MVNSFFACALFLFLIADINANRRMSESARYRDNGSRRHHPSNGGMSGRRIMNGEVAKEGEFPYLGYMMYNELMYCGMTIIHERWLLTAAHCVSKCEIEKVTMTFGSNYVGKGGQTYKPERFIIHKDYKAFQKYDYSTPYWVTENDIALVRLETDISFTSKIEPVKLPDDYYYQNYDGGPATIAGWGRQDHRDPTPSKLFFADVTVLSFKECRPLWSTKGGSFNYLCAKNVDGEGSCYGDSGTPLVTKTGILIGIMNRLSSDDCDGSASFYINLRDYLPWIKEVLSQFKDSLNL